MEASELAVRTEARNARLCSTVDEEVPWSVRDCFNRDCFQLAAKSSRRVCSCIRATIRPVRDGDCRHSGEEKFAEKHA